MINKFVLNESWKEPIILYSGLLPDDRQRQFIIDLSSVNILLSALCLNSSFKIDNELRSTLIASAVEQAMDIGDYNKMANAILSLIELDAVYYIKDISNHYNRFRRQIENKNIKVFKNITKRIFDLGTDQQLREFISLMTESSNNVFFYSIMIENFKRRLEIKDSDKIERNLIYLINKNDIYEKYIIFTFFFISKKNFLHIKSRFEKFIESIFSNKSSKNQVHTRKVLLIYELVDRFFLHYDYPMKFFLDNLYISNNYTAANYLISNLLVKNDFENLKYIIKYHAENKMIDELIKILSMNLKLVEFLLLDDVADFKLKVIENLTVSKDPIDLEIGVLLLNLRKLEVGNTVNCKVKEINQGIVELEVNGVLPRAMTFYNQLSMKVRKNFRKGKGSITFRARVVNFDRGSYVLMRGDI